MSRQSGSTVELATTSRWFALDMLMHAITVAMHLASQAGLASIADGLSRLHEDARRERDRA